MQELWNKRYAEKDFVYGKNPNEFLKTEIEKLTPGKILFLGEGDGRNSIFAAKLGWQVDAFDYSEKAKENALKYAEMENVKINYTVNDLHEAVIKENHYDAAVIVFLHLPENLREITHKKAFDSLKTSGIIILEVFDKDQLNYNSGGPKELDMLYSLEEVYTDFQDLELLKFEKKTVTLNEGPLHQGPAAVIRLVGRKNK